MNSTDPRVPLQGMRVMLKVVLYGILFYWMWRVMDVVVR